jgi:hypothetical protein
MRPGTAQHSGSARVREGQKRDMKKGEESEWANKTETNRKKYVEEEQRGKERQRNK